MRILGIETSCDETAAAIVRDGTEVLSSVISSQEALHRPFDGVVPEIACRAHTENLTRIVDAAVSQSGMKLEDVDAIAVTTEPGLVGALLVGVSAAKALAWTLDIPLIPVNHLAAHMYGARLAEPDLTYPNVALIVSGGHTVLFLARSPTDAEILGSTTDDAAGEAFDKVASILGLGYPGGPAIDAVAKQGDPNAVPFPRAMLEPDSLDFSFSGLKTAVLYHCVGKNRKKGTAAPPLPIEERNNVVASFQEAVVDVLVTKTLQAARRVHVGCVTVGGGVACNTRLRSRLQQACSDAGLRLVAPPPEFCTDNGSIVAGLAYHLFREGHVAWLDTDVCPTPLRARQRVG